jgi:hypothetical protein
VELLRLAENGAMSCQPEGTASQSTLINFVPEAASRSHLLSLIGSGYSEDKTIIKERE